MAKKSSKRNPVRDLDRVTLRDMERMHAAFAEQMESLLPLAESLVGKPREFTPKEQERILRLVLATAAIADALAQMEIVSLKRDRTLPLENPD
jgi:hypothetical protein